MLKSLKDGDGNSFDADLNLSLGEQADAASKSVVLSTGSKALVGAANETAPTTDTAAAGLNGRLQRIAQRITSLIALLPTALGQTTKSASLAVTVASDDDLQGKLGSLTETAPGTDTASSGLNGRLQRIAQRLTSLIALLPTSLGTKTAANSLAVTLASDGQLVTTTGTTADSAYGGSGAGTIVSILKWMGASLATLVTAASSAVAQNVNLSTEKLVLADGTQLTPKFAKIDASTSGANNVLVAVVPGKKIRVLQYKLTGAGAVNAKFTSDPAGTPADLTGLTYIPAAGGGESVGFSPVGLFETAAGKALGMNLSAAVNVGGFLSYIEV